MFEFEEVLANCVCGQCFDRLNDEFYQEFKKFEQEVQKRLKEGRELQWKEIVLQEIVG